MFNLRRSFNKSGRIAVLAASQNLLCVTLSINVAWFFCDAGKSRASFALLNQRRLIHHTGTPRFVGLPLEMIKVLLIDYMQILPLGITKRLLTRRHAVHHSLWLPLSVRNVITLNEHLNATKKRLLYNSPRKCRAFSEYWKAAEFR